MKKTIIIILSLILLTACAAKKEDFYNLSYGDDLIVVGYDTKQTIENIDYIDSYTTYLDKDENEILESICIYVKDRPSDVYIDGINVNGSIHSTCIALEGEYVNNNLRACVIHKEVKDKDNYVVLYGSIMNEDLDELDRLEIYYK